MLAAKTKVFHALHSPLKYLGLREDHGIIFIKGELISSSFYAPRSAHIFTNTLTYSDDRIASDFISSPSLLESLFTLLLSVLIMSLQIFTCTTAVYSPNPYQRSEEASLNPSPSSTPLRGPLRTSSSLPESLRIAQRGRDDAHCSMPPLHLEDSPFTLKVGHCTRWHVSCQDVPRLSTRP